MTKCKIIELIKHHSSNKKKEENIFCNKCKNDFKMSWTTDTAK